jgi:hypothetical protein
MNESTNELTNAIRDAMFDLRAEFTKQDKFRAPDVPVLTRNIMPHIIRMAMKSGDPVEFLGSGIIQEVGDLAAGLLKTFYTANVESSRPGYVRWPIGQVLDIIHKTLPAIVAGMSEKQDVMPKELFYGEFKAQMEALSRAVDVGKRFGGKETAPPEQGAPDATASDNEPAEPKG